MSASGSKEPRFSPDPDSRARVSQGGALAAASTAAATVLCCLPFAAGIVGAGVAALGARLAPFRPYLATISLLSLGYAFYLAYRPAGANCRFEECTTASRVRFRRVTVWLVATLVLLFLTLTWWASWLIYWTL